MNNGYEIKITLQEVKPAIWRRIRVPGNISLFRLHRIFQIVMGWHDSHLYEFLINRVRVGDPDPEEPDGTLNARKIKLSKLGEDGIAKFFYLYDFGDGWRHEVVIEKQLAAEDAVDKPVCLAGENACPPEDCGGPPGYDDLLKIIADPRHKNYKSMINWLGGKFDPAAFDLDRVNARLKSMR